MNRRRFLTVAGTGAAATALTAGGTASYARWVAPERVVFTRHRVRRFVAAPGATLRFAQLSDLHLRKPGAMHEAIAAELAEAELDFLLVTGDAVDDSNALPALADFLAMLPPVPKYAILGNWEHWGEVDRRDLARTYDRADGRLLVNDSTVHRARGASVRITGLDDFVAGEPDLAEALGPGRIQEEGHILLAHCPAQRDALELAGTSVDCILSGHTHGGQIRLLGWSPALPRGSGGYVSGWYPEGPAPMYVSRGIGTSVIPARLGAPPEVALFEWPART
ncbi:MAG: metallophosphoesterase [Gemmatimonadota bacterium]